MKKVAVLFSGGLDSSYLVWKNLKDGNEVFPIYIEIENNVIKTILEKNRIELLYKEFAEEFNLLDTYKKKINEIHYAIKVNVLANESSLYFKQLPIWMFSVVFLQGMDVDEVQIGYVSNDDAISYLHDIQNIYKSYQAVSEPMKPLVFPLSKMKKWQMYQELPERYHKYIFSCENAKIIGEEDAEFIEYEPCCECVPCKTIISTDYYGACEYPKNYRNGMILQHAYKLKEHDYKIIDKDGVDYFEKMCKLEPRKEPYQLQLNFDGIESIEQEENKLIKG